MPVARLEFDYDYDFLLFGISSHSRDYRMCWALNNALELQLVKEEDIIVDGKPGEQVFPFFIWDNEDQRLKYILVGNRSENGMLVAEQKQADYFLVIEGYYDQLDKSELLSKIRNHSLVLTAFELDPTELKSRQNLLFD